MAESKHTWSSEEEDFLLELSRSAPMVASLGISINKFYHDLAVEMNAKYATKHSYVRLTADKVKTKFRQLGKRWNTYDPKAKKDTSSGLNIFDKYSSEQLSSLFKDSETTISSFSGFVKADKEKEDTHRSR